MSCHSSCFSLLSHTLFSLLCFCLHFFLFLFLFHFLFLFLFLLFFVLRGSPAGSSTYCYVNDLCALREHVRSAVVPRPRNVTRKHCSRYVSLLDELSTGHSVALLSSFSPSLLLFPHSLSRSLLFLFHSSSFLLRLALTFPRSPPVHAPRVFQRSTEGARSSPRYLPTDRLHQCLKDETRACQLSFRRPNTFPTRQSYPPCFLFVSAGLLDLFSTRNTSFFFSFFLKFELCLCGEFSHSVTRGSYLLL